MSDQRDEFPTTNWSLVRDADQEPITGPRLSLNQLLVRYTPALQTHLVRRRRIGDDQAAEIVQSFIADKVIEKHLLAQADRSRGRFRDLLARSIEHFANDLHRRQKSTLRSPATPILRLDETIADELDGQSGDPRHAFDREWAESVIAEATRRSILHCERTQRARVWKAFQARTIELLEYDEICRQLGYRTSTEVGNAIVTAKRILSRMIRQVLLEHAGGGPNVDVEEELCDLKKILSGGSAAP